jgi:hypothetical protein
MKYIALVVALFTSLGTTYAQINIGGDNGGASMRIGGGIGLSNGESQVTMFNPNQKGNFLFLFPQMTPLEQGKGLPLQLWAVGDADGKTVFVWKEGTHAQPQVSTGAERKDADQSSARASFHTASVSIPPMLSGTSQIVRLDIPGIKAGSAISISPSEELPGMLAIAQATSPIDCVVVIKFINPGPFVPGVTMDMSVGVVSSEQQAASSESK